MFECRGMDSTVGEIEEVETADCYCGVHVTIDFAGLESFADQRDLIELCDTLLVAVFRWWFGSDVSESVEFTKSAESAQWCQGVTCGDGFVGCGR